MIIEKCKSNVLAYAKAHYPDYRTPVHIINLARILHGVASGKKKRVIVTIPPRHGKSMLISQIFPAWYLGSNQEKMVIAATYAQEFAEDFGRKVRNLINDPIHKLIFPDCRLASDSKASNRFGVGKNGVYFAVGVGGQATGRGANLFLIDDPIKSREEAESPVMQTKLVDWFKSVAYTRLMPEGAIVIVMARWNENDLVGYLLKEQAHENWEVYNMPALIDEGLPTERALWPEQYSVDDLHRIKKTLSEGLDGPYAWTSLYQQQPIPKGGALVKSEWLKQGFPEKKDIAAYYIGVDLAISEKDDSDETAMVVIAATYGTQSKFYEIETVSGHWDFEKQINKLDELNKRYRPHGIAIESVQYQKALYQVAVKLGLPVFEMKPDGDKIRRLNAVSHFMTQGRVFVNSEKLRDQMLRFRGRGERNDLVDAFVHALRYIRDFSNESYLQPEKDPVLSMTASERFFHLVEKQAKKEMIGELKEVIFDKSSDSFVDPDFF